MSSVEPSPLIPVVIKNLASECLLLLSQVPAPVVIKNLAFECLLLSDWEFKFCVVIKNLALVHITLSSRVP